MKELVWIDMGLVLAIHQRTLVLHGGSPGIRDAGGIEAALARPRHRAAYDETADITRLAAAYTAGIVQNHPFVDGNKRTGFVIGVLFLQLNGHQFSASEGVAAEAVIALAAGAIDEASYASFLRDNSGPI